LFIMKTVKDLTFFQNIFEINTFVSNFPVCRSLSQLIKFLIINNFSQFLRLYLNLDFIINIIFEIILILRIENVCIIIHFNLNQLIRVKILGDLNALDLLLLIFTWKLNQAFYIFKYVETILIYLICFHCETFKDFLLRNNIVLWIYFCEWSDFVLVVWWSFVLNWLVGLIRAIVLLLDCGVCLVETGMVLDLTVFPFFLMKWSEWFKLFYWIHIWEYLFFCFDFINNFLEV